MIAKLMHWVRKWIKGRKRKREIDDESKGYLYAKELLEKGIPANVLEQEVEDRIYFSRKSGHFEKGMLNFLENKKALNKAFQERRNYGHK